MLATSTMENFGIHTINIKAIFVLMDLFELRGKRETNKDKGMGLIEYLKEKILAWY